MINDLYDDKYFDIITEGWNKMSYGEIRHELISDTRLGTTGQIVLDVGCGTGLYYSVLQKEGNTYYGIDVSDSAVNIAQQKGIHANLGTAEKLPFSDQMFDYVFSTEVIEHVDSPEQMLREIYRVLKPGGCGLITTTTYQFVIFHYIWVLSEIKFRFRDFIKYLLGFFSKTSRDDFVKLLYDFTGGHLWGFLRKDILNLFGLSSLEIEEIYYLNVQPIIPLKLKGGGIRKLLRSLVKFFNGIFYHKRRAFYGPNIVIKFRKPE